MSPSKLKNKVKYEELGMLLHNARMGIAGRHPTQREMADHLKICRETYGRYERGLSRPGFDTLIAIGLKFRIPFSELLNAAYPEYRSYMNKSKTPWLSDDICGSVNAALSGMNPAKMDSNTRAVTYALKIIEKCSINK